MPTSGTYNFAPDNVDFIDEAWERCGLDPAKLTGRHFTSAMMSMALLFAHWATKGVKLFQVDEQTQLLTLGDADYTPAVGTLVILEGVIRRASVDTPVARLTREQYHLIPDKTTRGLPNQVWLDRGANTYFLWQVPENSTDVFRYRRVRRIQDPGSGQNTPDIPVWWFEALAAGLAWKLALKFAPAKYQLLIVEAEGSLASAMFEDRERADTSFGMAGL